jgi:hypothetical protein
VFGSILMFLVAGKFIMKAGYWLIVLVLLQVCIASFSVAATPSATVNRVIVLTDIEADPDDTQSLIRLMLYSNQIELQGLIATTSVHQKTKIAPESIRKVIHAYGKVQSNLAKHEPNFPAEKTLLSLVKEGLPIYGMAAVGEGKDSEGSDWIIKMLDTNDDRPLWISVWGGANTLAQSLYKLKATRSEMEIKKLIAKLRVYTISDQDDSGIWIRKNFPDLFYIVSPGGYGAATWIGMNMVVEGIDNTTIANRWFAENIQQGHGPLGAIYPDVAYGVEGDTPAFLLLIPNGVNSPEHPNWGGWGGRYELYIPELSAMDINGFNGGIPIEKEPRPIWTNAVDNYTPPVTGEFGRATRVGNKSFSDFRASIWRWRDEFQHDFAARMDWTTKPYAQANHPPVVNLTHPEFISVKSGQYFSLDAHKSSDPDGDSISFFWFVYPEAGSYQGDVKINTENLARINIQAPKVEKEATLHIIVRVSDKGTPQLTRYKRVIVTLLP